VLKKKPRQRKKKIATTGGKRREKDTNTTVRRKKANGQGKRSTQSQETPTLARLPGGKEKKTVPEGRKGEKKAKKKKTNPPAVIWGESNKEGFN